MRVATKNVSKKLQLVTKLVKSSQTKELLRCAGSEIFYLCCGAKRGILSKGAFCSSPKGAFCSTKGAFCSTKSATLRGILQHKRGILQHKICNT